jgi:hypothetical protein
MGQPLVLGTFSFTGFTDLTSVSWVGGPGATPFEHFHQFGNIVLQVGGGPVAVPEPCTLVLFALGIPAVLGFGRRYRRPGASLKAA